MAAFSSILLGVGLATAAAGSVVQYSAQNRAAARSERLSQASQDLQNRQIAVQEQRQKRQAYRDMLKAQAVSEANAGAQGGLASSALSGGLAQAANSFGQTNLNITENANFQREGAALSAANQRTRVDQSGSLISSIGNGISSLSQTRTVQNMGRLI